MKHISSVEVRKALQVFRGDAFLAIGAVCKSKGINVSALEPYIFYGGLGFFSQMYDWKRYVSNHGTEYRECGSFSVLRILAFCSSGFVFVRKEHKNFLQHGSMHLPVNGDLAYRMFEDGFLFYDGDIICATPSLEHLENYTKDLKDNA